MLSVIMGGRSKCSGWRRNSEVGTKDGWFAVAAMCVGLSGPSCGSPTAEINDVMGGRAELVAVDGGPVVRAQSKYVTTVPFALVDPGPHTFRVRLRGDGMGAPDETLLVSATVVGGKRYRFESRDRILELVQEQHGR
jgi:hypothetical protein